MKKLILVFLTIMGLSVTGGNIFAEKRTYSFENLIFKNLKEQGIEFYDSAIGEKQSTSLEKLAGGQGAKYIQTGDTKLKDVVLHTSEKHSDFGFFFHNFKTIYLSWLGSGLRRDLSEKAPELENEAFSYIEVPVAGKGTLTVVYHILNVKDKSKTSDNQQLAVYNQNGERLGEVHNIDFVNSNGGDEHTLKVPISEESISARIYFSKNYKKDEKKPLGTLAITSIIFKTEK
ncbi:hypothetical protein [uncultured Treponema sp.]|uniref:hypothetical protein n=1 Tax=uncultured Treponema sp. TaxID=162155 RepID=UPI0025EE2564|nr:hypothetical protein [uncultured Treponema sp.]